MTAEWRPDTAAVRAGQTRSPMAETSEALFLNSGYVYGSAEEAAAAFAGELDRHRYSRVSNPTVAMLQERVRQLEGAQAAWATASGMAAVFYALLASLSAGDRVVAARSLFGSCFVVLDELLPRYGITCDFVDGADLDQWEAQLATPAQAVFFESPANPMQTLVDIAAVAELAHAAGATVIVDNIFASPVFQKPLDLGADVVVYSTTKHMDGQGRTMGGMILGTETFIAEQVQPFMRHTGPIISPFNAWVVLKSLETMRLRVEHMAASALTVGEWLEGDTRVERVWFPWLDSHPQAELARQQMSGGGTVVTWEVPGGTARAFEVLNRLETVDISNNFADAKSLACHPATTTHRRIGPDARAAIGITDGVIRVSVGLEDVGDLLDDLDQALG
ncbi:O-succinylhomoserine sulfhydrylase [Euzebya tangerina]|uniref:O-succinylhomoserine sulfhydrylase n=1 Tax=Euzebya tangerina TaxID=591198 RepID=UPI000E31A772|nr:O-succinylhomoserine sulfhydrylase [Euzebya tangerina]